MAVILSAEDDPDIRLLITRSLERVGHRVVAVPSGDAALAQVFDLVPDLVLLDVEMPGTNGLAVCRQIRDNPNTAHIPVIIASGSVIPPFAEVRAAGGTASLPKPFTPHELAAFVDKFAGHDHRHLV